MWTRPTARPAPGTSRTRYLTDRFFMVFGQAETVFARHDAFTLIVGSNAGPPRLNQASR